MPDHFIRVANVRDIPENRCKLVSVNGEDIAIWKIAGMFYAINNVCPHQHFSKLNEGTLDGLFLTCPMHGWTFNLKDGRARTGNGRARVYRVLVEDGGIFIGDTPVGDD